MQYIGDFVDNAVVYLSFNTFTSDDPSASCTITNFINTDIHVHRDSGLTQRNNAAGVVVSVDFDGITGNHIVAIDTSDNTVADFWIAGHDYFVRAEGTTVDGATVNAFIAHFSIENRFMRGTDSAATAAALATHDGKLDTVDTVVDGIQTDLSNAADGLGALKTLIEANPTVGEIRTEMEGAGTKLLAIEGYTDKIDDATNGLTAIKAEVEGLAGAAMRGTDGANTTVPDAAGVAPTAAEIRTEMEGAGSKILAIEGDTNELQTNQGAWATATGFSTHDAADVKTSVEQAGSSLAQILEDTGTTLPAAIAAVGGYLLEAEIATVTDQTHITLATGSDVDDAYKDQTIVLYDDTNSDFPSVRKITAYTGATKAVTIDSAADFTVGADDSVMIFVTAPGTTAPTATENAIAVWDRILTGATHNITTSAGRRIRETGAYAIDGGTAQGGNGFSITLAATASGDDGVYNRNLIVLVDNTGAGQTRTIVDYNATSKVCVVDREWRVSPDATTVYQIVPDDTPLTVDHGRARGGTSTTIILRDYASSIDDTYLCNQIGIIAGPGRGQNRLVGMYNGISKTVTICGDPWVTTPTTDSIYVMMPYGTTCTSCMGDYALSQIKDECDDALSDVNLHKHDQNMKAIIASEY